MDPLSVRRARRTSWHAAVLGAFVIAACASDGDGARHAVVGTRESGAPARVSTARAALDRGDLDAALVAADAVLATAADDLDALGVSGLALLLTAETRIEQSTSDGFTSVLLEDALDRLARAPTDREVRYAAARAAWLLSRGERALELAHAAAGAGGSERDPWRLHVTARRIEYDAAWLALRQRRAANVTEGELGVLTAECLAHLEVLARLAPADPWAPRARAIVLASAGRNAEALAGLERAATDFPREVDVLEDYRVLVTRLHGEFEASTRLAAFVAAHEWSAAAHLSHGWALYELWRAKRHARGDPIFHARAEADRARLLDPGLHARVQKLEFACDSSNP